MIIGGRWWRRSGRCALTPSIRQRDFVPERGRRRRGGTTRHGGMTARAEAHSAGRPVGDVGSPPEPCGAGGRTPGRPATSGPRRPSPRPRCGSWLTSGTPACRWRASPTEAGVARATVYRRFKDKADLITAAIATNIEIPSTASDRPREDLIAYLHDFDLRLSEPFVEVIGTLVASRDQRSGLELHRRRIVEPRSGYIVGLLRRGAGVGTARRCRGRQSRHADAGRLDLRPTFERGSEPVPLGPPSRRPRVRALTSTRRGLQLQSAQRPRMAKWRGSMVKPRSALAARARLPEHDRRAPRCAAPHDSHTKWAWASDASW